MIKPITKIMENEDVRIGIKGNLLLRAIGDTIIDKISQADNDSIIDISIKNRNQTDEEAVKFSIESSFYTNETEDKYLIESRLFKSNNEMNEAYLDVLDENYEVVLDEIDDVWSYDEWNKIK